MSSSVLHSETVLKAFNQTDQAAALLVGAGRADKGTALAVLTEFADRIARTHPEVAEKMKPVCTEKI